MNNLLKKNLIKICNKTDLIREGLLHFKNFNKYKRLNLDVMDDFILLEKIHKNFPINFIIALIKQEKIKLNWDGFITRNILYTQILNELKYCPKLSEIRRNIYYEKFLSILSDEPIVFDNTSYIKFIKEETYININNPICDTCPISLNLFEENDKVSQIINCGHIFSSLYLKEWLKNHISCPLCRTSIINEEKITDDELAIIDNELVIMINELEREKRNIARKNFFFSYIINLINNNKDYYEMDEYKDLFYA